MPAPIATLDALHALFGKPGAIALDALVVP